MAVRGATPEEAIAALPRPRRRARFRSSVLAVATAVLILHAAVALTGPLWAPYESDAILTADPYASPSLAHPLGTDKFGRDVFSRLVEGERIMFVEALLAAGLAVAAGSAVTIVVAYVGGLVETLTMRATELVMSVPSIILSMLVLSAVGSSHLVVIVTVAFLFLAPVVTVIRAAALEVVTQDFVTSARLRGEGRWSIAVREILPNVLPNIAVELSLRAGFAAILIGGLTFLGFGAAPPSPDWGLMINEGRDYINTTPWPVLGPSLALGSLVVALSLFTEGLAERLGPAMPKADRP
jgi:peptide/nickel transport system permease protein